jgi:hypothetical protein
MPQALPDASTETLIPTPEAPAPQPGDYRRHWFVRV